MEKKQPEFFVATGPSIVPPDVIPPGFYHWPKLEEDAAATLLKGLQENPLITVIGPSIDPHGNPVGFWYYAPSRAAARRAIDRAMGPEHGMFMMEMSTSYRLHGGLAEERAQRSRDRSR